MIISIRKYPFGTIITTIHTPSFECVISTAKEGVFQPLSSVIRANSRVCGKIIYSSALRKSDIHALHTEISDLIDKGGERGLLLRDVLESIFTNLKKPGLASETINLIAEEGVDSNKIKQQKNISDWEENPELADKLIRDQKTILFVYREEDKEVSSLAGEGINEALGDKIKIVYSYSPSEAFDFLISNNVDMVISEVKFNMDIDGLMFLRACKTLYRELPFIIYCAYPHYKADLCDAYIMLSPDTSELIETVKKFLNYNHNTEEYNSKIRAKDSQTLKDLGAAYIALKQQESASTQIEHDTKINSNSTSTTEERPFNSFGAYTLNMPITDMKGLSELSPEEYKIFGRTFIGETIYKVPPVIFLDRRWNMMIGTVNDKTYKLNPSLVLFDKQEANEIAMATLNYCLSKLGSPTKQETGLFVWDTLDGNIIFQTADTQDGFLVNIFITSKVVATFVRL